MVEWSRQLRSVISTWLAAVRRSVQVRLCTSGCKSEKMFVLYLPRVICFFGLLLACLNRQPSAPIEFLVSEPIQNSHLSFQQEWGRFVLVDIFVIRQTNISSLLGQKNLEHCALGLFFAKLVLQWQPRLNLLFVQILPTL